MGADAASGLAVLLAVSLAIAGVVGGYYFGRSSKHASASPTTVAATPATFDPHVAAGAHVFVQFACAQCHGPQGKGGISPDVPDLAQVATTLSTATLRHIIDHGLGESKNPTKPYMPVWGAVISDQQVSDLVAYIHAKLPEVPTATPPDVPTGQGLAVAGSVLYIKDGCINCHGPNGLGGVPNPLSADKTIPVLSGLDFRHQFNTEAKIEAVIKSGSVIGKAPIVSMPHWGGIISEHDLRALVAYLDTLK
jgi:cbb3-type cytochrome c oxidase subunit III